MRKERYVFLLGVGRGGVGRGILEIFGEKTRALPTSRNGFMHDPSQTPTQNHLILFPSSPHLFNSSFKTKITGSEITYRKCYSYNRVLVAPSPREGTLLPLFRD